MAIIGAHMLLYTPEAEARRATLRDAFHLPHVDAGGGWLIFALPPVVQLYEPRHALAITPAVRTSTSEAPRHTPHA